MSRNMERRGIENRNITTHNIVMQKNTVAFRLDGGKKRALDSETHRWHIEHIKEGLRQAKAGEFASEGEVKAAFAKWRK
ncbi:MAG: hypothetical protein FD126_1647 [Elusimicrobia bacterium]|nr:MAG: hypothetical protein FD126_1647 [Elusimicrobiota bacterium]